LVCRARLDNWIGRVDINGGIIIEPLENKKLLVVSNRLPITIDRAGEKWTVSPGAGGLVTAMTPLMKQHRGLWIGWPGCGPEAPVNSLLAEYSARQDFELVPVPLTQEEVSLYYSGFSNQTIWPLFHDLLGHCSFRQEHWQSYIETNRRFARVVADHIGPDSFIWIHDYQLMLVGHFLRELGIEHHIGFFLHIPFPGLDLLRRLPWIVEIMNGLLDYDHLGFQTAHDRRNFINSARWFIPDAKTRSRGRQSILSSRGREVRLGFYPISIDFAEFSDQARAKDVADAAWYLHENVGSRTLVLGLDRLDYTKGMPERFLAFERMLEKYPDTHGNLSLLQIVVPSRIGVKEYQTLKEEIDSLAGRINSRFTTQGWVPIHYMYRSLDRIQLLGHYRACEIAFITPLRDGMNLVAKEYCAASIDNNGVLILSEFAGAADQLRKGALMVNPYDVEACADALYEAYTMSAEERQRRMRSLRAEVRRNDVHRWVAWFTGSDRPSGGPFVQHADF